MRVLADAQEICNGLIWYNRYVTSLVLVHKSGKAIRYAIDGRLTIEDLETIEARDSLFHILLHWAATGESIIYYELVIPTEMPKYLRRA